MILIQNGADPNAMDNKGKSPRFMSTTSIITALFDDVVTYPAQGGFTNHSKTAFLLKHLTRKKRFVATVITVKSPSRQAITEKAILATMLLHENLEFLSQFQFVYFFRVRNN